MADERKVKMRFIPGRSSTKIVESFDMEIENQVDMQ